MTPQKPETKKTNPATPFLYGVFIVFFVFIMINLVASQNISPLYFQMINDEKRAAATYLTDIRKLPLFSSELLRYKNNYGQEVEREVFKIEEARRKNITKLERALKDNPSSRDLLYNLSILYREAGDDIKAGEYLKLAKEIDPNIK
ncbi:hypothetical protein HZC27_05745 [Candidatus Roizmanbacteria bacterium]|nr:hypothetical protein [Candidatus Roizmanbacteria bacterium]